MRNDRKRVWAEDLEIIVSALSLFQHSYPIELLVLVKLYLYIDMILYPSYPCLEKFSNDSNWTKLALLFYFVSLYQITTFVCMFQ